ncbi:MAG: Thioredoxin-like [2Fe-2S] ferredoxin [Acetothermia bacterium 64_32]|nr:MAG: Thioredoxin-like [2Fe-2S] ferredoxin [Acetothermia bacterium 64_32]HAF69960.1 2Fe-2S ferredoxin [Candidatus Acetothermia bacterium]
MNLEELRRIRERAKERLRLRGGTARVKIVVGMGTSGLAAGARQTLRAIMDELARRGLGDVIVTQTGERGLAAKEPVVEIHEEGRITVYGEVDEALARRLVAEHVVNGRPIQDHVIEVRKVEG